MCVLATAPAVTAFTVLRWPADARARRAFGRETPRGADRMACAKGMELLGRSVATPAVQQAGKETICI